MAAATVAYASRKRPQALFNMMTKWLTFHIVVFDRYSSFRFYLTIAHLVALHLQDVSAQSFVKADSQHERKDAYRATYN